MYMVIKEGWPIKRYVVVWKSIVTKIDLMISELNVVGVKQLLKEVYGYVAATALWVTRPLTTSQWLSSPLVYNHV